MATRGGGGTVFFTFPILLRALNLLDALNVVPIEN